MPRSLVAQRKRIFIGCEGESERSYIALLQRLIEARRQCHLEARVLNGGDPLATIASAVKALRCETHRDRGAFIARFVLLDADLLGRTPERDREAREMARAHSLNLIWQEPCHEALILRHLDDCQHRRPASSQLAHRELRQRWPAYRKNATAAELACRIDAAAVRRVCAVEKGLRHLAVVVGL